MIWTIYFDEIWKNRSFHSGNFIWAVFMFTSWNISHTQPLKNLKLWVWPNFFTQMETFLEFMWTFLHNVVHREKTLLYYLLLLTSFVSVLIQKKNSSKSVDSSDFLFQSPCVRQIWSSSGFSTWLTLTGPKPTRSAENLRNLV